MPPEFVRAFEALAQVATRGGGFRVHAPLIELTKAQIIALGMRLGVDYAADPFLLRPDRRAARVVGAMHARCAARGFAEAGVPDPTRYAI